MNHRPTVFACLLGVLWAFVQAHHVDAATFQVTGTASQDVDWNMDEEQVGKFAKLALDGIGREYPNKPSNVMADADGVRSPREMHPSFYGSFDWHSSVHGHWLLVRVLKLFPGHPMEDEIRSALAVHLAAEPLQIEAEYFAEKLNRNFERMYGWAWALRLVEELHHWDDKQGQQWRENLRPLEDLLVQKTIDYLPKLTWPIRTGVHPDSAFAIGQILDYARTVENRELEQLLVETAMRFYSADRDYPAEYEPSGEDFFSAGLNEADLMRRVLESDAYEDWLSGFFPELPNATLGNLLTPVGVSDVTDGKIVHLAGLNLSRAWTLQGIASALPEDSPVKAIFAKSANEHAAAGLAYVFSGHYEGEHWLATFAIYHLTKVGVVNAE